MKNKICLVILSLFVITTAYSQHYTNTQELERIAAERNLAWMEAVKRVQEYAAKHNIIELRTELEDGTIIEMVDVKDGLPIYYITDNIGAAATTKASSLWTNINFGGGITGAGFDKVAVWDGGRARVTHQEFNNTGTSRIITGDNASNSDHATHVAGTIIAGGVQSNAKGMAFEATLKSYDWSNVESEMPAAANNGYVISNHSWGHVAGWYSSNGYSWDWYGNPGDPEDYKFGCYTSDARTWDNICHNAPFFLIVKSAGNDRGDGPSYAGTGDYPEKDGGADGFDCVSTMGVAKNILTVGAVNKVSNYTGPSSVVMSSFSGWGPADDGRIKPDIVAAGVSLYSSGSNSDTHYSTKSGTSMSTPNTTGSLVLLLHYYEQIYETSMRSSTIKAIAIHTAEECGPNEGPDYMFGWGLLNVEKGANLINDNEEKNSINELTLNENQTFERYISVEEGEPLRATICWIDPPGTANNSLNNRTPVLVNDLDIKIVDESENIYYPYKLSPYFPSAAATKNSTNDVDNVEQVYIANPSAGIYKIIVTHKGSLQGGSQDFSLITSYLPGESLSDDDLLSDLTVSHGTLIPAFDGNITNYSVEVENNVTNIEIIATTNHPNASVAGDGNKILAVGSNQFDIVVTAQNGISTKTYSISVYREASDDATLSNLAVNQGELTPSFNPNTTSYTVNVLNNITNIEITGTANHINAQVVGNGEKPLNVGANPFDIIVTAEDNITTLTYNVVVYREAIYYVLSSSVNGSGGSIEPIGEIEVEQGSNQDYNITPITGFKISSVLIDGINNPSAVESGVYSFENVTSNHSIIVAFEPIDFMITAEAGEGGNIVPSGIIHVNYGENQTFMFESSANFIIESVLIDGENIPEAISDGKYTFEYVTQNHNISVTFKQNAGIDDNDNDNDNDNTLMLYPNPTKNKFVVKTSLEIIGKVMLYNMAGSLLFEENVQNNSVEIDLSNYSAGVYFLNVEGKQLKVIKQ